MDTTTPVTVTPKPWYQSKTLWFAVLTGLSGIIAALESQFPTAGILVSIASVVNIILRFATTAPLQ